MVVIVQRYNLCLMVRVQSVNLCLVMIVQTVSLCGVVIVQTVNLYGDGSSSYRQPLCGDESIESTSVW